MAQNLRKHFPLCRTLLGRKGGFVRAVDGVNFSIAPGEILGLAGESGSGKSTVGRLLAGLYLPTAGEIRFGGRALFPSREGWGPVRKEIQMVFQDPGSSLNPRRTAGKTLEVPLRLHQPDPSRRYGERIAELLAMVELSPDFADKLPRSMSGGQRQRVAIARALACHPSFIVLDEPTSALDVSVQAKIVKLLLRLREQFGLSYLFISHDLGLMRNVADRTAVMYLGKVVELAPTKRLFTRPLHPYTQLLLSSIPVVSAEDEAVRPKAVAVDGEMPSPVKIPPGCSFSSRCPSASARCRAEEPIAVEMAEGHFVQCHLVTGRG
jgi:oligopeptide/dipeptide ABC transporter ATP-binding protein